MSEQKIIVDTRTQAGAMAAELYDMGLRSGLAVGNDLLRSVQEWHDVDVAAAERRGWDQAIAALRDGERFSKWDSAQTLRPRGPVTRGYHADYLTAVRDTPAAEGGTEHG